MEVKHKIVLDFARNAMPPILPMVQGDSGVRTMVAYLVSGSETWEIPADTAVVVNYVNSDGSKGTYDTLPDGSAAYDYAGNRLTIHLVTQVLAVAGMTNVAISLIQRDTQLSTFRFRIFVEGNLTGGRYPGDYVNLETWFAGHTVIGPAGPSAYEIAKRNGFVGSEIAWLQSLIGPQGPIGPRGPQGFQGKQGESGVTVPVNGFFTLTVDSDTGDLYVIYSGDEASPQFELTENGELYLIMPEE